MNQRRSPTYRAYLLRCWQEQPVSLDEAPLWRFMLQEISGEQPQRSFGSFEELVAFLSVEVVGESKSKGETKGGCY